MSGNQYHHFHQRPSREQALRLWRQAQAVCFDVDCTVTKQDALDHLGKYLGVGDQIADLTNQAMNGHMDLDEALQKRLEIMQPTVDKLVAYAKNNPAEERLVPGIRDLVAELHARNVAVFLISGGFRELILPVADALGIPRENIFANRFVYRADDELNESNGSVYPTIRVRGFDRNEPTSREGGKPEAIRQIRAMNPYNTVVMVGDGITDLEAVQETGGADLFVGYGGVARRDAVKEQADWWITNHQELNDALPRYKVAMIGSGAWACASMQMVSYNCRRHAIFHNAVDMWVYEEDFEGSKLTDKMNELHENPKYLPGVKFGDNVVANPNLQSVAEGADLLIFCTPHQFVHGICKQIQMHTKPGARAISLIKGMHLSAESGPQLISNMIRKMLSVECSALMGANLAAEIRPGGLCESTIGSHYAEQGELFRMLFDAPYFSVNVVSDVEGAELAGTLKNIVALAAGFADGCKLGENAKAAVLREGLHEMLTFAKAMFPATVRDETFLESCGVADLIATCYGGRNHRVARAFAECGGEKTFEELERELLKGQKLQGALTSNEVFSVLESRGWVKDYPLFAAVECIVRGIFKPQQMAQFRQLVADTPTERLVGGATNGDDTGAAAGPDGSSSSSSAGAQGRRRSSKLRAATLLEDKMML